MLCDTSGLHKKYKTFKIFIRFHSIICQRSINKNFIQNDKDNETGATQPIRHT